jgi:parallel beta-helix repeat protein
MAGFRNVFATAVAAALTIWAAGPSTAASVDTDGLHCGSTVMHSVRLHHDILGCTGDGLDVAADHVVVDLNGHTIGSIDTANIDSLGIGVNVTGHNHVVVKNGRIVRFGGAVLLLNANYNLVTRLSLPQVTGAGVEDFFGTHNVMSHLTSGRAAHHIDEDSSVGMCDTDQDVVASNHLTETLTGVLLCGAQNTRIEHNLIVGNHEGINSATSFDGVRSTGNLIAWNIFRRGVDFGVILDDNSDSNIIRGNIITGSGWAGIGIAHSANNLVRGNNVDRNLGGGIAELETTGTKIIDNRTSGNGFDAAACLPDCPGFDDGINVSSPGTLVRGNTANRNADLGIEAGPDTIDGGNNHARGNGDARQCVNVTCRP